MLNSQIIKKMFSKVSFLSLLFGFVFLLPLQVQASVSVLHNFDYTNGSAPQGNLLEVNGVLYGVTESGGDGDSGVLFSISPDGNDYTILHHFGVVVDDGETPTGWLSVNNGLLYGSTSQGGTNNFGTIFSYDLAGSSYSSVYSFPAVAQQYAPVGSAVILNDKIYGVTEYGQNTGSIFSVDLDGSNFSILHAFAGGVDDGRGPKSGLTLDNGVLYGATSLGGQNDVGVLFSINPDGSDYTVLHHFESPVTASRRNFQPLVISNSIIYGSYHYDEGAVESMIFSIQTDGSNFTILKEFTGSDGLTPAGALLVNNSTIYGSLPADGDYGSGGIFSLQTDGSDYQLLHSFNYEVDADIPEGGLIIYDNTLFGLTLYGAFIEGVIDNQDGTIFSYALPEVVQQQNNSVVVSSNSSSSFSSPSVFICEDSAPHSSPDLFQIDAANTTVNLYFSPVLNSDKYYVAYSTNQNAQEHGFEFYYPDASGVIQVAVNDLAPSTKYYFKVRGGNGCMTGDWSTILSATTARNQNSIISFYKYFMQSLFN